MRVVLDTNILISGILWEGNEAGLIQLCMDEVFENFTSIAILNELERALNYEKFKLTEDEIEHSVYLVTLFSSIVQPDIKIDKIKKDTSDNMFLECAVASNSQYIISGDSHLLDLGEFEGIKIIRTKEMLNLLEMK